MLVTTAASRSDLEERAVALVGLHHQPLARVRAPRWCPPRCTSPPMRKLGSQPAARRISVSIDDVVVLPWLPATAMPRAGRDDRALRIGAPVHRDPACAGDQHLGVVVTDRSRDDQRVDVVSDIGSVVPEVRDHAEVTQPLQPRRLADVGTARRGVPSLTSTLAIPLIAEPPIATMCTVRGVASSSSRSARTRPTPRRGRRTLRSRRGGPTRGRRRSSSRGARDRRGGRRASRRAERRRGRRRGPSRRRPPARTPRRCGSGDPRERRGAARARPGTPTAASSAVIPPDRHTISAASW